MEYEIVIHGVVAEKDGKYFGVQYEDGHSTEHGFGPIENATIGNPKFTLKPTYFTYYDSPYYKNLMEARLVKIVKTVKYEVEN